MPTTAQHQEAKQIVDSLGLSPAESLAVRAVACHETKYGRAWPEGKGAGSFNMGAVMTGETGTCSGFAHQDSNPDKEFTGCFQVYPNAEAGYRGLAKVMLKANTKEAIKSGDLRAVAQAMYDNSYYTGTSKTPSVNVDRYTEALRQNLDTIIPATGEPDAFAEKQGRGKLTRGLLRLSLFVILGYGAKRLFWPTNSNTVRVPTSGDGRSPT